MSDGKSNSDFEAHEKTYDIFIKLAKWTVISIAITMVLLYFIVNP